MQYLCDLDSICYINSKMLVIMIVFEINVLRPVVGIAVDVISIHLNSVMLIITNII